MPCAVFEKLASTFVLPNRLRSHAFRSVAASIGVALCVAAGTAWLDCFTSYRVARFGDDLWAAMAISAFVFTVPWYRSARASTERSALRWALCAVPYAMATSAMAASLWTLYVPATLSPTALFEHAMRAAAVALFAAAIPVWFAPLLCVLAVFGVALFVTQRACLARKLDEPTADALVARVALLVSLVFVGLSWSGRLPHTLLAVPHAVRLTRSLSVLALLVNGLAAWPVNAAKR